MAAGFKKATVNASDVPSTLTNYPAYVDLSRVGITTLAEAQSVRCYSDVDKTIELAREIVNETEMHVKVSSLTSTYVLYIDWDGVRSDYAVTDTYGRNAVWTDYAQVVHFEEDPTTDDYVDSTGNGNDIIVQGTAVAGDIVAGKLNGNGAALGGNIWGLVPSSAGLDSAIRTATGPRAFTHSLWTNQQGTLNNGTFIQVGASNQNLLIRSNDTQPQIEIRRSSIRDVIYYFSNAPTSYEHQVWQYLATGYGDVSHYKAYKNGTSQTLIEFLGSYTSGTYATSVDTQIASEASTPISNTIYYDEQRVRISVLSADWITTEYNNQSDESGFWGSWSDGIPPLTVDVFDALTITESTSLTQVFIVDVNEALSLTEDLYLFGAFIETLAASNITSDSAILNGNLIAMP